MTTKLIGVPETLLIALWARAAETQEPRGIIDDRPAVRLMQRIDYDFTRFGNAKLTKVGIGVRTLLLDAATKKFLDANPKAIVVNMGAGLDTRQERLQHKNRTWYDIDLPESIELRRKFYPENKTHRLIARSIFDYAWINEIPLTNPILFIAEGLLMYFEQDRVRELFAKLAEHFPGAELLIETGAPLMVGNSKKHETVRKIDSSAEFKWGVKAAKELCELHPKIELLNDWDYFDFNRKRWGLFWIVSKIPFLHISNRIVHLCLR